MVALIEELDPNDIRDCEKILAELAFGEKQGDDESFTQLCSRHRQRTLAGLGLQTRAVYTPAWPGVSAPDVAAHERATCVSNG